MPRWLLQLCPVHGGSGIAAVGKIRCAVKPCLSEHQTRRVCGQTLVVSSPSQVSKGSQDVAVQTHFSQNQSTDQSQPCLGLCPTTFPRSSFYHQNLLVETWQRRVCRMARDGLCVLSGACAPILTFQRGAGGLAPQAIPVPLEMAGR